MGFSRQEYWSGLPFPSPGDLPAPEAEPASPALADGFFTAEPTGKPYRFPRAVIIKYHKPSNWHNRNALSKFWKLKVQDQGFGRLGSS